MTNEQRMLDCLQTQFKYYVDHIGIEHSQAVKVRECLLIVTGKDPLEDNVITEEQGIEILKRMTRE